MKTLFLAMILTFIFGGIFETEAQTRVKVAVDKQKTVTKDRLKIKFMSLVEDSRCPTDANCIWAGNAKIKIRVTDFRGRVENFELNTNGQPQSADFAGWHITLENLTPHPKTNVRINRKGYIATLSVSRLTR